VLHYLHQVQHELQGAPPLIATKRCIGFVAIMPRPPTVQQALEAFLEEKGPGYVFTRPDLRGLADTGTLGKALARLTDQGKIKRLQRGLFQVPRFSARLGQELPPQPEQVAEALARKFGWTIIPHGSWAANRLGLIEQVPAQLRYLSSGPDRTLRLGKRVITFTHARPKDLGADDPQVGAVIQALRYLGRARVDEQLKRRLRKALPADLRRRLLERAGHASDWLYELSRDIAPEAA